MNQLSPEFSRFPSFDTDNGLESILIMDLRYRIRITRQFKLELYIDFALGKQKRFEDVLSSYSTLLVRGKSYF